jgi:hypothetical protein
MLRDCQEVTTLLWSYARQSPHGGQPPCPLCPIKATRSRSKKFVRLPWSRLTGECISISPSIRSPKTPGSSQSRVEELIGRPEFVCDRSGRWHENSNEKWLRTEKQTALGADYFSLGPSERQKKSVLQRSTLDDTGYPRGAIGSLMLPCSPTRRNADTFPLTRPDLNRYCCSRGPQAPQRSERIAQCSDRSLSL